MLKSVYNAAYLSIAIGFLRNTYRKLIAHPACTGSNICHTVLLRPTPPGPLPIVACESYALASRIADLLNRSGNGSLRFFVQYPREPYDQSASQYIRRVHASNLSYHIAQLPRETQELLQDAMSKLPPYSRLASQ